MMSKLTEIRAAAVEYQNAVMRRDENLTRQTDNRVLELEEVLSEHIDWLTDLLAIAEVAQAVRDELNIVNDAQVYKFTLVECEKKLTAALAKLEGE